MRSRRLGRGLPSAPRASLRGAASSMAVVMPIRRAAASVMPMILVPLASIARTGLPSTRASSSTIQPRRTGRGRGVRSVQAGSADVQPARTSCSTSRPAGRSNSTS